MEQAKAAVQDFTSKVGHHDTTVHEHAKPAVTREHITPTRHENVTTAIDKEVHQDHHHTTIQPIHDKEVLPEKHHHNIIPVEHKEHHHGDKSAVKERLEQEAAQFRDVSETGRTKHTQSVNPVVGGEHVHHHVHETIQPVIQKETIQPSVVHTTVPIHEVHHNDAKHHAATALPAVSLADFKKQGGTLTGREEKIDRFDGHPGTETAAQHSNHGGIHHHGHGEHTVSGRDLSNRDGTAATGSTGQRTAGPHSDMGNKLDPRVDSDLDGSRTVGGNKTYDGTSGSTTGRTAGPHGDTGNRIDPRVDSDRDGSRNIGTTSSSRADPVSTTGTTTNPSTTHSGTSHGSHADSSPTATKHKPSLLDKLNPLKDSDGDGKRGFMK